MHCDDVRQDIDRIDTLVTEQRAVVHRHLADCTACRDYFDAAAGLADILSGLSQALPGDGAPAVKRKLAERSGLRRGEYHWALAGAVVTGLAAIWFFAGSDPLFAKFALAGTLVVMITTAWRSSRAARTLASGDGGLDAWRAELEKERHHILVAGPLVTAGFFVLTAVVVARSGLSDPRAVVFSVTWLAVLAHTVWRLLIRRPVLNRELQVLGDLHR